LLLAIGLASGACIMPGPRRVGDRDDDLDEAPGCARRPAGRRPVAPPAAPAPPTGAAVAGAEPKNDGPIVMGESEALAKPAVDAEMPRARRRSIGAYEVRSPPPRPVRPGSGLGFETGFAFGGDDLVNATLNLGSSTYSEKIQAGDGGFGSVVGSWTPLWISDALGLGVAASLGVKYNQVAASNGHISFTRFPIALSLQTLLSASDTWFVLVRTGMVKDAGASLSGSGAAGGIDAAYTSRWGVFGDFGLYRAYGVHGGMAFMARYTAVSLTLESIVVRANSLGAAFGWYYAF
jgi:hypothetical protein